MGNFVQNITNHFLSYFHFDLGWAEEKTTKPYPTNLPIDIVPYKLFFRVVVDSGIVIGNTQKSVYLINSTTPIKG